MQEPLEGILTGRMETNLAQPISQGVLMDDQEILVKFARLNQQAGFLKERIKNHTDDLVEMNLLLNDALVIMNEFADLVAKMIS